MDCPSRPGKMGLLEQISSYVDEHLSEKITLQVVAGHCNVSVSTVTQLFQKEADVTFHQYLTRRRMDAAQKLIASGMHLEEAGKLVGYSDHSSFYRAFRQTFGVSPRAYRRDMEQQENFFCGK